MLSLNSPEADRRKNQFGKEERLHLLGIMTHYAPLLDKSGSTLARKDIWTAIEKEFRGAGYTGKSSAQLKKYWQNYKYHCKKAKALGKSYEERSNPGRKRDRNTSVGVESEEWNWFRVAFGNRPATKLPDVPGNPSQEDARAAGLDPGSRSVEMYEDNGGSFRKLNVSTTSEVSIASTEIKVEREDDRTRVNDSVPSAVDYNMRNHVVVSNAKISDNSVTVSVIYPKSDTSVTPNSLADEANVDSPPIPRSTIDLTVHERDRDRIPASNQPATKARNPKTRSDSLDRRHVANADYCNELKRRMILHQLEAEEGHLKVKIAEMAIQEIQLRIKALNQDMRRTEELHRLHLALALRKAASVSGRP